MQLLVQAKLPTDYGEFEMLAYPSEFKDFPHIVLKSPSENDVLNLRIHSECMTGDVFSSQRCDCGGQLNFALRYLSENGGLLIYLRQEGRGIGIVNKMKAYNLQDQGLDTYEANEKLGFHQDQRDYSDAIAVLKDLGISKVNLLTNSPDKIAAFDASGIEVVRRTEVLIEPNENNKAYLNSKREKRGHLFNFE